MIIRHNVYPSYSISAAARAELCKELHAAQVQSQLRCQTEVSTVGSMLEGEGLREGGQDWGGRLWQGLQGLQQGQFGTDIV